MLGHHSVGNASEQSNLPKPAFTNITKKKKLGFRNKKLSKFLFKIWKKRDTIFENTFRDKLNWKMCLRKEIAIKETCLATSDTKNVKNVEKKCMEFQFDAERFEIRKILWINLMRNNFLFVIFRVDLRDSTVEKLKRKSWHVRPLNAVGNLTSSFTILFSWATQRNEWIVRHCKESQSVLFLRARYRDYPFLCGWTLRLIETAYPADCAVQLRGHNRLNHGWRINCRNPITSELSRRLTECENLCDNFASGL